MARKKRRRQYGDELKTEAVQMLLDGHSAESVVSNLGLGSTGLLYRWKASRVIRQTVENQGVSEDQLTIHSDRGPSMASQSVVQLRRIDVNARIRVSHAGLVRLVIGETRPLITRLVHHPI